MTDRTEILQRVLNLRGLAESSGSESEAMNAMKIADKMMRAYRIEEAELALAEGLGQIKVEIVDETRYDLGLEVGRVRHKVQSVIWAIERYCEVEVVLKGKRWSDGQRGIHVIGDKPDVELFWYLLGLIRDSLDKAYAKWLRTQQGVGRGAKASFQLAMGRRIAQRLDEMLSERRAEQQQAEAEAAKLLNVDASEVRMAVSNGKLDMLSSNVALVVASANEQKRAAVNEAYRAAYKNVRLGTASGFSYRSGNNAAAAGRAAGDRVNLGRPLGGSSAGRLT